ncbi:MAG: hypothetical protein Q8P08_02030, partial [bacterium]|nr:hypothetical protein [bacterium]
MSELSQPTRKLIEGYQSWQQSTQMKEGTATVHVDEVASKVAAFYEKMRGVVDWKEEHLFRKTAVERALKRRILFKRNGEQIAGALVYELIRGGHFPNDKIPESKIEEVQKLIDKYIFILDNAPPSKKEKMTSRLYDWLIEIAACEVEEILAPPIKEKSLLNYATELIAERTVIRGGVVTLGGIGEEEKNTQIYIALQRTLFNFDSSLISYNLLNRKYPQWRNLPLEQLRETTQNIYLIREGIKKDLNHLLADKFFQVCERYDTPYLILGDVISENPMEAKDKVANPELLETSVRYSYNKRSSTLKSRLGRAAFYATLSIFLTNILSLYAIEIPLAKFVLGHFSPLGIAIDIFAPTLLMFLLIVTVKLPKKENLEVVIMEVMKIAYVNDKKDIYEIRIYKKRGVVMRGLVTIFYFLSFLLFTGLIVWGLSYINLPPTSHFIFIVFVSLIAFAGTKIRRRARELQVIKEKENFFYFLIEVFSIPITQLGKWLSTRWTRYNAIARFFSSLIDLPFQVFIEFLE